MHTPSSSPARVPAKSPKTAAPSSDSINERGRKNNNALGSLVRAEKLIQIALLLPIATLIGWAIGLALDRRFHQHWIYVAGLVVGAAAGFVQIFRVVLSLMRE